MNDKPSVSDARLRRLFGSRWAQTLIGGSVLMIVAAAIFGLAGAAAAACILLLAAAWRHDNDLGTCFPLAVLFLIIIATLTLLMALVAMLGR